MPEVTFYEVLDPEGKALGTITARGPDEIHSAVAELLGKPKESEETQFRVEQGKIRIGEKADPKDPIIPKNKLPNQMMIDSQVFYPRWVGQQKPDFATQQHIWIQALPARIRWVKDQKIEGEILKDLESLKAGAAPGRFKWLETKDGKKGMVDTQIQTAWIAEEWRESFAALIAKAFAPKRWEEFTKDEIKTFTKAVLERETTHLDQKKAELETIGQSIQTYKQHVLNWSQQQKECQAMIAGWKPRNPTEVSKMLERISKIEGVEALAVEGQKLVIYTTHIYIENELRPDGTTSTVKKTRYDIGKFKVTVDLQTALVQIQNRTRTVLEYHHPHVHGNRPCLGEIQATVPDLISKLLLPELVTVLVLYLRSVDVKDVAGSTIIRWPVKRAAGELEPVFRTVRDRKPRLNDMVRRGSAWRYGEQDGHRGVGEFPTGRIVHDYKDGFYQIRWPSGPIHDEYQIQTGSLEIDILEEVIEEKKGEAADVPVVPIPEAALPVPQAQAAPARPTAADTAPADPQLIERRALRVGDKVRRNPNWCWDDQDTRDDPTRVTRPIGTVISDAPGDLNWFTVLWPNGRDWNYRYGAQEATGLKYDLELVEEPVVASAPAVPTRPFQVGDRIRLKDRTRAPAQRWPAGQSLSAVGVIQQVDQREGLTWGARAVRLSTVGGLTTTMGRDGWFILESEIELAPEETPVQGAAPVRPAQAILIDDTADDEEDAEEPDYEEEEEEEEVREEAGSTF